MSVVKLIARSPMRIDLAGGYTDLIPFASKDPGACLLYTSPSPRDRTRSRMPSSA